LEEKMVELTPEKIKEYTNKIAQYRGVIIHDSINIEALINAIITIYFVKANKNNEFSTNVIGDEFFSFGLKINILDKLKFERYKEFIDDIRRINKIRNFFAHCLPTLNEELYCYNQDKKMHEPKKLDELHKEFLEKIKKINPQLDKIFDKLVEEDIK
jgi:hypothetical protein